LTTLSEELAMSSITARSTPEASSLLYRHSLALTIALHLLPGVAIVAAYIWVGLPVAESVGYPSLFGLAIAGTPALILWELGLLLYLGRRRNQRWSLEGVVLFRNRIPTLRLSALAAGLIVWAIIIAAGLSFIDSFLLQTFFFWVPDRFQLYGFNPTDYSLTLFNAATLFNLLLFGIAAPYVEELYFRGFLLPRMSGLGRIAPFANSVLFAFYHLWTPWLALTRILFLIPLVWFVWKKQSVQLGILTHCTLNCIGILLTYGMLMSAV
jgi:membrane protease YdiL (CAAX protease family)